MERGGGGGGGGREEIKKGLTQNRFDYQPLIWDMNLSCLRYFLSSQGGASLDARKQQKSSLSPIFASHQSPYPPKHQIIMLLEKRNISLLNLLMSETIKLRFYPFEGGGGEWGVFYKVLYWEPLP